MRRTVASPREMRPSSRATTVLHSMPPMFVGEVQPERSPARRVSGELSATSPVRSSVMASRQCHVSRAQRRTRREFMGCGRADAAPSAAPAAALAGDAAPAAMRPAVPVTPPMTCRRVGRGRGWPMRSAAVVESMASSERTRSRADIGDSFGARIVERAGPGSLRVAGGSATRATVGKTEWASRIRVSVAPGAPDLWAQATPLSHGHTLGDRPLPHLGDQGRSIGHIDGTLWRLWSSSRGSSTTRAIRSIAAVSVSAQTCAAAR